MTTIGMIWQFRWFKSIFFCYSSMLGNIIMKSYVWNLSQESCAVLLSWPLWPDIEISNPRRPLGKKSRKYFVSGSECLRMRISTSNITNTDTYSQMFSTGLTLKNKGSSVVLHFLKRHFGCTDEHFYCKFCWFKYVTKITLADEHSCFVEIAYV